MYLLRQKIQFGNIEISILKNNLRIPFYVLYKIILPDDDLLKGRNILQQ